jgi:ATP-dependent DNA helicase RecG
MARQGLRPYRRFRNPSDTPSDTPSDILTPQEQKVLDMIIADAHVDRKRIALQMSISVNTAIEYLNKLKNKGVIRRAGSNRWGYWEVLKK